MADAEKSLKLINQSVKRALDTCTSGTSATMECPHLNESVQITTPSMKNENPPSEWCCAACKSKQSPWLCLGCGVINCGRYVAAHAKLHFEERSSAHCVCMDCNTLATFCYICDEFVINDTSLGQLDKIRTQLQLLASTQNNIKENRGRSRRHSTDSNKDNKKKRLKTDNGTGLSTKIKTSGLRNLGNTCFMNAVLQSLSNIHSFCGYIKQLPSLEVKAKKRVHQTRSKCKGGDDVLLIEELRKTLVSLWQGSKSAISPESLFSVIWKVVPRFRGYQQQDAHEFMRYLLDRLHTELLSLLPYPNSSSPVIGLKGKSTIVTTVFGGLLQSEVNCLTCGMYSKKHDPFLDLSLDIPSRFTAKSAKPKEGETLCHLSDCLSSFTDLEELEESEFYKCSNCKRRQRSTKKFWIRRLPNVLCLHLKRFRWSSHFREKIETYVSFPLQGLDMSDYLLRNLHETRNSCSGTNEYDLAAVIVHHGSGAGSGHYTSYAIHEGRWYHFNDSSITACDEETVVKCKGYILFYVRRELKIPNYPGNSTNDEASTSGVSNFK